MTALVCGAGTLGSTATALLGNSYAGYQITLPCTALLNSLTVFVNTTGAGNGRLGLYTNGNATKPAQLVAQTASTALGLNLNTMNVLVPVVLAAGGYWIAFQTDSNTAIINSAAVPSGQGYNYALAYAVFDQAYNAAPTASTTILQVAANFTVVGDSSSIGSSNVRGESIVRALQRSPRGTR